MSTLLGAQVITWLMASSVTVVVPRLIGPESVGESQLALSIWAVGLTTVTLGTNTLVMLQVARQQHADRFELGPPLVARLVGYVIAWIPLGGFVLIAGYGGDVISLFVIYGFSTLVLTIAELARASLTGLEHFAAVARADVISKVVMAALMITAAVTTEDVRVVAAALALSGVVSAWLLFRDLHASASISYSRSLRGAWGAVRASAPYFTIGVAVVLYMQLDVVLMSFLVSDIEIGWYGLADTLFSTLLFAPSILMTALFPRQAREHVENPAAALETLEQGFRTLMIAAVPIGLGIMVVAHEVVDLLYTDEFAGTGAVFAVYGVVLMLMFETILLGQHSISIGRQNFWCILMVIGVVMTLPLDLVFVPWADDRYDNGAIGGALSYVVTESMMLIAALWKLAPGLVSKRSAVRLAKCAAAGTAMVCACWPLRERSLPLTIVVGGIVYATVLTLTRPFDESERDVFRRVTSKFSGRLRRA